MGRALLLCILMTESVAAQTISKAEYFFDTDPGTGNGTPISFAAGDPVTFTSTISTTGLGPGHHFLFVRTRTSTGKWSLYEPKEFIIDGGITAAEYFFDTDPGVGNGTALAVTPGSNTITPTIPSTGLSDGDHYLFVRTKHDGNVWSLSEPRLIYIRARIIKAEYFIDTDPGFGNGTTINIAAPTDLVNVTATIPTGALADGVHYLFIRTKEILGKWSLYEPQPFTVDSALPIELIKFQAFLTQENFVQLKWSTATEINNDYFTLQHSLDGLEFEELERVQGSENSGVQQEYERFHFDPAVGPNYYRLKQTDKNGLSTLSKVVKVDVANAVGAMVYPNPAAGEWFIDFRRHGNAQTRQIELYDVAGRLVFERKNSNESLVRMTREGYAGGTYVLKITTADGLIAVHKVIFH